MQSIVFVLSHLFAFHAVGSIAARAGSQRFYAETDSAKWELLMKDAPRLAQEYAHHLLVGFAKTGLDHVNAYASGMLTLADKGLSEGLCPSAGKDEEDTKHHCIEPIQHPIMGEDEQYLSYKKVEELLTAVPQKQAEGSLTRGNELGLFRLGPKLWSEETEEDAKKIGLGASAKAHQRLRPVFDELLDEGSDTWTEADLEKSLSTFMQENWFGKGKTEDVEFLASDISKWTVNYLHKIHFGFELESENFKVEDFEKFQKAALAVSVLQGAFQEFDTPAQLLLKPAYWVLLKIVHGEDVEGQRREWVKHYMQKLTGSPKELIETTGDSKEFILKGLLESLLFAGGLSVPSLIKVGLAVLHSEHSPLDEVAREKLLTEEEGLEQFIFEVARRYPAVVGFPFYEKVADAKKPQHKIGNVAIALRDPEVFEDPLTFNPKRDITLLRQKMGMAWAEPANGKAPWSNVQENPSDWSSKKLLTPNSHGCPGEKLSFAMMRTFFKLWIREHQKIKVVEASDKEFMDRTPFAPDLKFRVEKQA